jgi:hypothetical protein
MKFLITSMMFFLALISTSAQNAASVYFSPVYQNWSVGEDAEFNELTNFLSINYSAWRSSNFNLVTRYSSVGGDANNLKGFSDTQLSFGYKIPSANLMIETGISIPTGKTKLNADEYMTSILISQSIFGMQTSNFGQGMNMFLGAAYLYPLSKSLVLGAGLSYQVRSEYQPLESISLDYTPSDEITATAGLDLKLNEVSTLTGDVIAIFYGSDKVNGQKIFTAGRRLLVNIMYRKYIRFDSFSLIGSYRSAGLDRLETLPAPAENEKVIPDQIYLDARYAQYVSSLINLNYNIFFISFEKTLFFYSGYNFFGASFSPEFKFSPSFKMPLRFKFMSGSADNKPDMKYFDLGIGFTYIL